MERHGKAHAAPLGFRADGASRGPRVGVRRTRGERAHAHEHGGNLGPSSGHLVPWPSLAAGTRGPGTRGGCSRTFPGRGQYPGRGGRTGDDLGTLGARVGAGILVTTVTNVGWTPLFPVPPRS